MLNIGFIGLGWITEKVHLPYLSSNKYIGNIGVFEIDKQRISKFKDLYNFKWIFDSAEDLMNSSEIDLVIIATPNYLHYEQIITSLKNGKYVFCEKPICINLFECTQLEQLISKYPNKLFMGLQNRFRSDVVFLKNNIGTIGNIYRINSKWLRNSGIPRSNWFLNQSKSGGGVLLDLGSHIIDLVLWLTGNRHWDKIASVKTDHFLLNNNKLANWHGNTSYLDKKHDVEDNVSAFIKTKDRCSWYVELGWAGFNKNDETIFEFFGDRGYIKLEALFGFSQNTKLNETILTIITDKGENKYYFDNRDRLIPYYTMLNQYIDSIINGNNTEEDYDQIFSSFKIINQIYQNIGE